MTIDPPMRFGELAGRFGMTQEELAGLILEDFCAQDPECLVIIADDPSTGRVEHASI